MIHQMGLYPIYFSDIKAGRKSVEIRLNDNKRKRIKTGDTIEFISVPDEEETLKVKVTKLEQFSSFRKLYESIPFEKMGCSGWTMKEMLEGTYEIYTKEQEEKFGALAITIELTEFDTFS